MTNFAGLLHFVTFESIYIYVFKKTCLSFIWKSLLCLNSKTPWSSKTPLALTGSGHNKYCAGSSSSSLRALIKKCVGFWGHVLSMFTWGLWMGRLESGMWICYVTVLIFCWVWWVVPWNLTQIFPWQVCSVTTSWLHIPLPTAAIPFSSHKGAAVSFSIWCSKDTFGWGKKIITWSSSNGAGSAHAVHLRQNGWDG